jgi:hypothetical protein
MKFLPGGRLAMVLHLVHGTFRRDRHGDRIDAPPQNYGHRAHPQQPQVDDAEAERRKAEAQAWLEKIKGLR